MNKRYPKKGSIVGFWNYQAARRNLSDVEVKDLCLILSDFSRKNTEHDCRCGKHCHLISATIFDFGYPNQGLRTSNWFECGLWVIA